MKRFYDRLRPGCPKDDGGVPLVPEKRNGSYAAPVVKPRVPATPNAQVRLSSPSASLEGLAVELQHEILQRLPDLPTLDAIVHASQSYHRAYVARRQSILAEVVLSRHWSRCCTRSTCKTVRRSEDFSKATKVRDAYRHRFRSKGSHSLELPALHKSSVQSVLP